MPYLATFHTTTGAMQFEKFLKSMDYAYTLKPVPRSISASCGISIAFSVELDAPQTITDLDKLYTNDGAQYIQIFPIA